jgi:ABC-type lipoprotein release transport system permease subunit
MAGSALLILVIALMACLAPVLRAARMPPAVVLREQ